MKKFLLLLIILFITITLASCNYQPIDLTFNYNKVHIIETNKCYVITSWRDYEDGEQVQVTLNDGTTLLLSTNTSILIEGNCPICKER